MRSFSRLRQYCNHPEVLPDRPSKARDDAAALGTLFHSMVQLRVLSGEWDFGAPEPVAGWLRRMAEVWTVPDDLEAEVACGIADEPLRYVSVREPEPHRYEAVDGSVLLTAGRADLVWEENGVVRVCDLKTGQSYLGPPNDIPQLRGQCLAISLRDGGKPVVPMIYYARLGMMDKGSVWDLENSMTKFNLGTSVRDYAKRSTAPNPGPHCLSCYSKRHCMANPERKAA